MTDLTLTVPVFSQTEGVLFSAYGVDRGYLAYALSFEAGCERLGSAGHGNEQMLLAFKLNHPRILRAIAQKQLPAHGQRVVLDADDFE